MTGLLAGKVAIVTGGTGGLGLAAVERFCAEGAEVVIGDIRDDAGSQVVERLGEATTYVHTDVTDEGAVEALVTEAVSRFGKLDIMYNNAGVVGDPSAVTELGSTGFDDVLAIDARSVLLGHKWAARQFQRQGTPGSIVTTASVAGVQGGWSTVGYTAAKHTVVGIVRQAAHELGRLGIRCNALAPSVVMSAIQARTFGVPLEQAKEFNDFIVERIGAKQAMGRFGMPEDVAKVATFLASDLSDYVNGAVIPVDGGASAASQNTFPADMEELTKAFLA